MSKIVFFSIPAHGHTNPTIAVVDELVRRGHEVWYYSFYEFQEKIETAGAKFIPCDNYLPELTPDIEKKVGKDFASLIEMAADMTMGLDEKVCRDLKEFQPNCIVSDSICIWGKLFAIKLNVPYICSTTTFAMNKYTAKLIKQGLKEMFRMFIGIPRINKKIKLLQEKGYNVKNFISIIQNDNDTDTIVYTSKEFQPMVETFSDKYAFVGPSFRVPEVEQIKKKYPLIYISLGTVLNQNIHFYQNCIKALGDVHCQVIMSVGEKADIFSLGKLPDNFKVYPKVQQLKVLQHTDVFITHCGMNSISESLYFGVPSVLFPLHSEQAMVANRVAELNAGKILKSDAVNSIRETVLQVLNDISYKRNAEVISKSLQKAGGASAAANKIEKVCNKSLDID
ncbi:macrolide family glycosyltransferase [Clostridium botulinum]|uniref:macrolide family glycosyltransferase n=1 Tax=Clostridium botulinum TaxID=1491 RepID=UPI000A16CFD2|nr:macrolide family glycosyltransferase [Clostridium botulinum]AUN10875.1 glucosyltransferase [Clostridium botulinum]OSA70877.1 glucosyltransferase [Clostridium botulinum]